MWAVFTCHGIVSCETGTEIRKAALVKESKGAGAGFGDSFGDSGRLSRYVRNVSRKTPIGWTQS